MSPPPPPPSERRQWATNVLWADLVGHQLAAYYIFSVNDDDEEPAHETNAASSSSSSSTRHNPPSKGVLKPFNSKDLIYDDEYEFLSDEFL